MGSQARRYRESHDEIENPSRPVGIARGGVGTLAIVASILQLYLLNDEIRAMFTGELSPTAAFGSAFVAIVCLAWIVWGINSLQRAFYLVDDLLLPGDAPVDLELQRFHVALGQGTLDVYNEVPKSLQRISDRAKWTPPVEKEAAGMYVGVCKLALWLLAAVVVFWIAGSYIPDLTFVEGQGTVAAAVFLLAGASITGFFAWNILQLLPKTTPRASRLESVDEIKDGPDPSRWPGHAEQFFQQLRRGTEPNRHLREGWKHEATEIDNNTRVEGWWTAETQPRIEEHPVPTNISWLLIAGVGLVLAGLFLTTRPPNGTVLGLWDLGSVPSAVAYGLWVVQGLFFARAGTTALRSVTLLTSITRWRSVATFVHAEGTVNQESVAVGDADTDSVRGEVEDVSSKMMVRSWTATIVTESRGFEGTRRIIEMIDDSEAQQARDLVVEACERFAKDAVKAPEIDVDERTVKANLGIEGAREQARAEGRQAALEGSDAGPSDRLTEASAEDALPAGDVAFCPACGTEVGDKASFCSSCGEEIPS